MGGPDTAAKAVTSLDIPGYGTLSMAADASAPLLVVFGGIDVGGVQSGHYMWNYMGTIKDRFHIFVALGGGPALFSSIYLVDIWMGVTQRSGSWVPDFYKALVNANAAKITYVYTTFGANNDKARDYIASKVRAILVKGKGMQVHMGTNAVAVSTLG